MITGSADIPNSMASGANLTVVCNVARIQTATHLMTTAKAMEEITLWLERSFRHDFPTPTTGENPIKDEKGSARSLNFALYYRVVSIENHLHMDEVFSGYTSQDESFHDGDHHPKQDSFDDEADDAADGLSDDEEEPAQPPVPLMNTRALKRGLEGRDVTGIVREVLDFMSLKQINLPLFLEALSWGDPGCHSDAKVQYAWTVLMVSDELPGILERWYNPPEAQERERGRDQQELSRYFATSQESVLSTV
ncbi:uncharacterized protein LACBIDRAFT_331509 [Laccaria bicolor S238N-H82]|uniref:Predicted protein n=1 Tax=Laccaria bicolor (strain S238N-H82 / ATCC MYA-4686) TaxID=486041 RepID=B0DPP2_LACBS|nr:uncharacterized protein LACBIDRAFT_331509 [Laccaria bicolor S238N-H82]EDR03411.1 predicted protein [Laccaria bicolor S238N-H82]|eukprot:XP_001885867.1 predicted protein [Laccaria bicolor S238N-H82]